ncbi:hypothetical protein [Chryseobacterium daeguense]|uniref:hypothetical protein n=1 Tax=Chryseobacterium daeguense TaxID=412438 RepID=UPI00041B5737|nr:hypothetical protein [Chryseobacterium daeguense]
MPKDVLYLKIAKSVTGQIKCETLQFKDRLSSEKRPEALQCSRPTWSWKVFFGRIAPEIRIFCKLDFTEKAGSSFRHKNESFGIKNSHEDLIDRIFGTVAGKDVTHFALGIPGESFLPTLRN